MIHAIIHTESERRAVIDQIRAIPLPVRVEACRYRRRRTDRQNRAYWPLIVKPFAEWLSEQNGCRVDEDAAHEVLKNTFLRVAVCDANGEVLFDPAGDPLMRTRSTTELDTREFAQYFDDCGNLLAEMCGIVVPQPDPNHAEVAA